MTDITQPPPGYITIQDINRSLVGQLINLIGVVVDVRDPIKSRGADWVLTLRICDRTRALAGTSLMVRYFKAQLALPRVHNTGDILILRRLKISDFNGAVIGLACFETQTIVLYSAPVPANTHTFPIGSFRGSFNPGSRCTPPSESEYNFASSLSHFWKARGGDPAALGVPKSVYETELLPAYERRRKFSLVKDLQYGNYYDLAGEVVKTFGAGGDWFTVYLTDYTKHPQLYNYDWDKVYASTHTDEYDYTGRGGDGFRPPGSGAERNWPGPLGRYTIQVTLWDSHAVAARNMELEGQVVMLRNVKIRKNKDENMEGWMNGDKKYPDKVGIEVCKDAGLRREVRVRKEVYVRAFERQRKEYEAALEEKWKEGEEKRRAERERAEERRREANQNVVMDQVRIGNTDDFLPTTSFAEILHIATAENRPFVNHKYRVYARVVDFLPHDLEDFAVKVEPRSKRPKLSSSSSLKESQSLATQAQAGVLPEDMVDSDEEEEEEERAGGWEWRFGLVLEDKEGTGLPVVVDNFAGQMLLGLDACELRKHPQQLAKLREQLFVLWGTVEEQKRAKLGALALEIEKKKMLKRKKPGDERGVEGEMEVVERRMEEIQSGFEAGRWFEGAVQEYGVVCEGGGTRRRWGLVGTRIKA